MKWIKKDETAKLLNRLKTRLHNIATMAVDMQENIEDPDFISDALVDIEYDLEAFRHIAKTIGTRLE